MAGLQKVRDKGSVFTTIRSASRERKRPECRECSRHERGFDTFVHIHNNRSKSEMRGRQREKNELASLASWHLGDDAQRGGQSSQLFATRIRLKSCGIRPKGKVRPTHRIAARFSGHFLSQQIHHKSFPDFDLGSGRSRFRAEKRWHSGVLATSNEN